MKRYVFFVSTMGDGGAQRVISILSQKMAEREINVEIVTYYDIPVVYEIDSRVKVTCAEKETGKKGIITNIIWLRKYLKQNAKVVLSFLAPFNIMAIVAMLGTGIPIIVADRNDPARVPVNKLVRILRDFLYRFANGIVLQTEHNKAYFSDVIQKKARVIYNPVELKEYTGIGLQTKKQKKIVSVGRYTPQKNQKMLIRAFSNIAPIYPEYQLIIYGEGAYRAELEKLIKELGLSGRVLLPGSVTDLYDKIKDAELFVLSSDYEGMPNALIEAMCLGLSVISTKVSGAADLIENGINGVLVDLDNEEQLTEAIRKTLADTDQRTQMAKNAVKLANQLLPDAILQQWLILIEAVEKGNVKT